MNEETEDELGRDDPPATTRRALLGSLGVAGVAGCLGLGSDGTSEEPSGSGFQTVGPDGGPEPTETPEPTQTPAPTPTTADSGGRTAIETPDDDSSTATAAPATEAGAEWPSVEDPYYSALQDDLAAMGLPPGEFVYADDEAGALSTFQVWSDIAQTSSVSVTDDRSFSAARRVEVTEEPDNPWSVTMNGTVNNRSVAEGDVLLGVVHLRTPVSSPTDSTVQFVAKDQDNQSTNNITTQATITPPTEWTRYYVPMQWGYDSEAGTWWWELFHGFGVQTTDVGGIALVDFDRSVKVEDLPRGAVTDGE
ncbi:glycoside hydrolase family 10 [Halosimplex carlsbadense 2-9-1]|uniref:Glycoside hydrolase family 10 n=1 Tax=Halosimplex carlsbadense 2-9-1 TaxID=797114 RepID=M0CQM5_9EURY|nr:hypothetical protein [Halosimplex carlsbadense]ELZ24189.1 glycoside hydrolase family 10 [Halosimplex carlsbadense 2-9-1]